MGGIGAAVARFIHHIAAVGRLWHGDLRASRAGHPQPSLGARLRGRRSLAWNDTTERGHGEWRDAAALVGTAAPPIDIVCVTSRSRHLSVIARSFREQTHAARRLIVVLNGDTIDLTDVEQHLGDLASDILVDRAATLGACLNAGVEIGDAPLVAKWDDDDWYGPHYLADHAEAWKESGAAIVGKHSYFAYLERSNRMIVRFPGREHRRTSFVAGGTLLLDRTQLADLRFPDVSIAEDGGLLRACEAAGGRIHSGSRFGYVQRRGDDNTWIIDDDRFARVALDLGPGLQLDRAFR